MSDHRDHKRGLLVQNISSAIGGVHHEVRKWKNASSEHERKMLVVTHDPHPQLSTAMKALVGKTNYACRQQCAHTDLGWVVVEARAEALSKLIDDLHEDAEGLNARAEKARSSRRVRVGIVFARFVEAVQQFEAVDRAVGQGLHTLADLIAEGRLRDGATRSPWRPTMLRMMNLHTLLKGDTLRAYKKAIDTAASARKFFLETDAPSCALAEMDPYVKAIRSVADLFHGR